MICTGDDVALALGVGATGTPPGPYQAAWLDRLALAASDWVERHCRREFRERRAAEYYTGTGSDTLVLRRRPVLEVYSVKLEYAGHSGGSTGAAADDPAEAAFAASDPLVPGQDYALVREGASRPGGASGLLLRVNAAWPVPRFSAPARQLSADRPQGRGNVRVDYRAGYPPGRLPPGLVLAAAGVAAHWALTLPRGGLPVVAEKLGRWEVRLGGAAAGTGADAGLPPLLLEMLAPYCEPVF